MTLPSPTAYRAARLETGRARIRRLAPVRALTRGWSDLHRDLIDFPARRVFLPARAQRHRRVRAEERDLREAVLAVLANDFHLRTRGLGRPPRRQLLLQRHRLHHPVGREHHHQPAHVLCDEVPRELFRRRLDTSATSVAPSPGHLRGAPGAPPW